MQVTRDGNRLLGGDPGKPGQPMVPLSETRFWLEGGLAPLRFELDDAGQILRLVSEEEGDLVLERVPAS